MFCPKCGKPIPDDSVFCMFCGKSIPKTFHDTSDSLPVTAPNQAAPDPFGDSDEPFDFLPDESFEPDEPLLDEPSESWELPDDLELPDSGSDSGPRVCALCGRELPASNVSGICVTCTNNRSFVPVSEPNTFHLDLDLDDEYPEEILEEPETSAKKKMKTRAGKKERKHRFPLLPLLLAVLLLGAAACFAAYRLNSGPTGEVSSDATTSAATGEERQAASCAQSMVKAKAANPSSVHFDARSLSVSEKDGEWTVKQSFERLAPDGQMAQSSYTAVLRLDESAPDGYKALMLQVDDNTLYDYR